MRFTSSAYPGKALLLILMTPLKQVFHVYLFLFTVFLCVSSVKMKTTMWSWPLNN